MTAWGIALHNISINTNDGWQTCPVCATRFHVPLDGRQKTYCQTRCRKTQEAERRKERNARNEM